MNDIRVRQTMARWDRPEAIAARISLIAARRPNDRLWRRRTKRVMRLSIGWPQKGGNLMETIIPVTHNLGDFKVNRQSLGRGNIMVVVASVYVTDGLNSQIS